MHPDAGLVDADGDVRKEISFSHAGAMQLLFGWHEAALSRLAAANASCIHSIQPTFNNQYETKYTQVRRVGWLVLPVPSGGGGGGWGGHVGVKGGTWACVTAAPLWWAA